MPSRRSSPRSTPTTAAIPRQLTSRSGPTRGAQVGRLVAGIAGRPLLTWQRTAADVGLEVDPSTGWYRHGTVVLHVPRQAGKTHLIGGVVTHRCITTHAARVFYTAQSGTAAAAWLRDEHLPWLSAAEPLRQAWRARLSQGSESISWPELGSRFAIFSPTRDALHGKQSDLAVVDEAWAHDALSGGELLQAIGPTQATRRGAQVWIVSAAGDAGSTFLADQLALARAGTAGYALIDYGVPDDQDAEDPAVVARWHPGVVEGLITLEHLRTERARMGGPGFARAYGGRFTDARAGVIPDALWRMLDRGPTTYPARPLFGFDVDRDGGGAAIVASWPEVDRWRVELVDDRPGTGWVPDRLAELYAAYRTPPAYGAGGPALAVADVATRSGTPLSPIVGRDWYAACELLRATAADQHLAHAGQPGLDRAVAAADARHVGDQWTWDRRIPGVRLSPLTAATAALWAATHDPGPAPRPVILGSV